jgi:hypothetical protein
MSTRPSTTPSGCYGLPKETFLADERKFPAPLGRPTCSNVSNQIDSHKSDHRPSYLSYGSWQRRKQLKTDLREIFGAARFSTFFNGIDPNGH